MQAAISSASIRSRTGRGALRKPISSRRRPHDSGPQRGDAERLSPNQRPQCDGDVRSSTTSPDNKPPTITVNGNNPATLNVGDTYADLGATVTDNVDENLGIRTFLDGMRVDQIQIDTSIAGEHRIDYVATDQAGNTSTSTRSVIVSSPANDNVVEERTTQRSNPQPPRRRRLMLPSPPAAPTNPSRLLSRCKHRSRGAHRTR